MTRGVTREELLDSCAVSELRGILGMARELLQPAKKQDLHTNLL